MKALFLILTALAVPLFSSKATTPITIQNPLVADSFVELILIIINFLFYLSLPIASLIIVISAWNLLLSSGEPEKVKNSRNMIIYALVGVLVLYLSVAIVNLLVESFT